MSTTDTSETYQGVRKSGRFTWRGFMRDKDGGQVGLGAFTSPDLAARAVDLARIRAGLPAVNFPDEFENTIMLADAIDRTARHDAGVAEDRSGDPAVAAARKEWVHAHGFTASMTPEAVIDLVAAAADTWKASALTLVDGRWLVDFMAVGAQYVNTALGRGQFPPARRESDRLGRPKLWIFETDVLAPMAGPYASEASTAKMLESIGAALDQFGAKPKRRAKVKAAG